MYYEETVRTHVIFVYAVLGKYRLTLLGEKSVKNSAYVSPAGIEPRISRLPVRCDSHSKSTCIYSLSHYLYIVLADMMDGF